MGVRLGRDTKAELYAIKAGAVDPFPIIRDYRNVGFGRKVSFR